MLSCKTEWIGTWVDGQVYIHIPKLTKDNQKAHIYTHSTKLKRVKIQVIRRINAYIEKAGVYK